jgi:hypothetical protein
MKPDCRQIQARVAWAEFQLSSQASLFCVARVWVGRANASVFFARHKFAPSARIGISARDRFPHKPEAVIIHSFEPAVSLFGLSCGIYFDCFPAQ